MEALLRNWKRTQPMGYTRPSSPLLPPRRVTCNQHVHADTAAQSHPLPPPFCPPGRPTCNQHVHTDTAAQSHPRPPPLFLPKRVTCDQHSHTDTAAQSRPRPPPTHTRETRHRHHHHRHSHAGGRVAFPSSCCLVSKPASPWRRGREMVGRRESCWTGRYCGTRLFSSTASASVSSRPP